MKFMILGSGMQGRACAFDMLRNPKTEEILLADSCPKTLASAKAFLKSNKKVKTLKLSATDVKRVQKIAADYDVLVSAVPYFLNLPLAKAAIAAKTHFVDLGGSTEIVLKELALHNKAVKAGITILPDQGLGPGMISTIAEHGIRQLDVVEEVYLRDGGLPQKPVPPMNYMLTFSEHGLINEYVEYGTALRNGKRVAVRGISEVEPIDLPAPFGRCEAAHAAGGLSTMAYTYEGKIKTMDNKFIRYPGHLAVIEAMTAMGFFSKKPVMVNGKPIVPRDLAAKLFRDHFDRPGDKDMVIIRVTVRGKKDGRRAEIVYDMLDKYDEKNKMTSMMRTTAFPVSIAAQMLGEGGLIPPGAYPVERGIPPEPFFKAIKERGFNLSWKMRYLEGARSAVSA